MATLGLSSCAASFSTALPAYHFRLGADNFHSRAITWCPPWRPVLLRGLTMFIRLSWGAKHCQWGHKMHERLYCSNSGHCLPFVNGEDTISCVNVRASDQPCTSCPVVMHLPPGIISCAYPGGVRDPSDHASLCRPLHAIHAFWQCASPEEPQTV